MRPVERGVDPGPFATWGESRDPLLARLGKYCSYCERPLSDVDVEHKEPKAEDKYPDRALDWENFLVACGYCNPIKNDKDTRRERFYFPDEINTLAIFCYPDSGRVELKSGLHANEIFIATRTRDYLLNLNRLVDTNGNRDLRWYQRLDVWREAKQALENLREGDSEALRRQIVSTATGWGCFSIWLTAFAGDPDMCHRFLAAFPGTRRRCFDTAGQTIPTLNL